MNKIFSCILIITIIVSSFTFTVGAVEVNKSDITLLPADAFIVDGTIGDAGEIGFWRDTTKAEWQVNFANSGKYKLSISYSCLEGNGGLVDISIGNNSFTMDVNSTGDWDTTVDVKTKSISIPAGATSLTFSTDTLNGKYLWNLFNVTISLDDGNIDSGAEDTSISLLPANAFVMNGLIGDSGEIGFWQGQTSAEWQLNVEKAGNYVVTFSYSAANGMGGVADVSIGNKTVALNVESTGDWNTIGDVRTESITIPSGKTTLNVKTNQINGKYFWNLYSVTITSANATTTNNNVLSVFNNKIFMLRENVPSVLVYGSIKPISDSNKNLAPIIKNDVFMIPVSYVSSMFKAQVKYASDLSEAEIIYKDKDIIFKLGEKQYVVNGVVFDMPEAPCFSNMEFMIPIRIAANCFNQTLIWDNDTKIVLIGSPDEMLKYKGKTEFIKKVSGVLNKFVVKNDISTLDLDAPISKAKYVEYIKAACVGFNPEKLATATGANRFAMWEAGCVAMAYSLTGDERLGKYAAEWLRVFAQSVRGDFGENSKSNTMQQYHFGGYGLCKAYEIMKDTNLMKIDKKTFENSLAQSCTWVARNYEIASNMNRGAGTLASLSAAKKLFPNNPDVLIWKDAINFGFYENGVGMYYDTNEDASGYNILWCECLLSLVENEGIADTFFADKRNVQIYNRFLRLTSQIGYLGNYGDAGFAVETGGMLANASTFLNDSTYSYPLQSVTNLKVWMGNKTPINISYSAFRYIYTMADDAVAKKPPLNSYYSDFRMNKVQPDKLALLAGKGTSSAYSLMNFYDLGGHGHNDDGSIGGYFDGNSVLLYDIGRGGGNEQYKNLLYTTEANRSWPNKDMNLNTDVWKRTSYNLTHMHTKGSIPYDITKVTGMDFRLQISQGVADGSAPYLDLDGLRLIGKNGEEMIIQDFDTVSGGLGNFGEIKVDPTTGNHFWRIDLNNYVSNSLSIPPDKLGDWSGYDRIELWYKTNVRNLSWEWYVRSLVLGFGQYYVSSTANSLRLCLPQFYTDYNNLTAARVNIDYHDYLGEDAKQFKDIQLVPQKYMWVRDNVTYPNEVERRIGQNWQIQNILQKGKNWFLCPPVQGDKNLLVYFVPVDNYQCDSYQVLQNSQVEGRISVFQTYVGKFEEKTFNTILLPWGSDRNPIEFDKGLKILLNSDDGTILDMGVLDRKHIISGISTSKHEVSANNVNFFGNQFYIENNPDGETLEYVMTNGTKTLTYDKNQILSFNEGSGDVEINYNTTGMDISVKSSSNDKLSLLCVQNPSSITINGVDSSDLVTFNKDTHQLTIPTSGNDLKIIITY